jgi:hypothetical protein
MDDRWKASVATIRRRGQGDRSADKIRRRNLALLLGFVVILLLPEQGPCRVDPLQSMRYTDCILDDMTTVPTYQLIRMTKPTFLQLLDVLTVRCGLRDGRLITAKEKLAIWLITFGQGKTQRFTAFHFSKASSTISLLVLLF